MFDRIIVVCTGNICRSPFGEAILKQYCPNKKICSAGIGALVGHAADSSALEVAQEMGVDLSNHKGQQITKTMCHASDLILVMEREQQHYIARFAPAVTGKTMLFGHWLSDTEILDPYRQNKEYFQRVFKKIQQAARAWQEKI